MIIKLNVTGGTSPEYSSVTGTVYDEGSVKGIPNARVRFGSKTVFTDDDGNYELLLPEGTYDVEVTHPDYDTHTGTAVIQPNTDHKFNFWLGDENPFTATLFIVVAVLIAFVVLLSVGLVIFSRKRASPPQDSDTDSKRDFND